MSDYVKLKDVPLSGIVTSYICTFLKSRIGAVKKVHWFQENYESDLTLFTKFELKNGQVVILKVPKYVYFEQKNQIESIHEYLYDTFKEDYPEFFI
jgi:hypothetical protein